MTSRNPVDRAGSTSAAAARPTLGSDPGAATFAPCGGARPLRVGVVWDLPIERWVSMDYVAEMLTRGLEEAPTVQPVTIRPDLGPRVGRIPVLGRGRAAHNLERALGRFARYPLWLRRHRAEVDVHHVIDHSYAQLVHDLPAERTVVTCHDLDAFRCVLEPEARPRSLPFRWMARRQLDGMLRAARIVCDSGTIRDELLSHGVASEDRVRVVPLGTHPTCTPAADPDAAREVERLLGPRADGSIELLHVGSSVPRKRIDVLLRVFARVRERRPEARLVRVGGLTREQEALVDALGIRGAVSLLPYLERATLAAVYRRADLVLQPSDAEGFGLPVVEALACGVPVAASDLTVLREVGGASVAYAPPGEVEPWVEVVAGLLREREAEPARWLARREAGVEHARDFSWREYTQRMIEIYREVAA